VLVVAGVYGPAVAVDKPIKAELDAESRDPRPIDTAFTAPD
jgi:hypothetical protein